MNSFLPLCLDATEATSLPCRKAGKSQRMPIKSCFCEGEVFLSVRAVCTSVCSYGEKMEKPFYGPNPGCWFRPEYSIDFLKHDLEEKVGNSGRPVVVFQHYGFDAFSNLWWSDRERVCLEQSLCVLSPFCSDYRKVCKGCRCTYHSTQQGVEGKHMSLTRKVMLLLLKLSPSGGARTGLSALQCYTHLRW